MPTQEREADAATCASQQRTNVPRGTSNLNTANKVLPSEMTGQYSMPHLIRCQASFQKIPTWNQNWNLGSMTTEAVELEIDQHLERKCENQLPAATKWVKCGQIPATNSAETLKNAVRILLSSRGILRSESNRSAAQLANHNL